MKHLRDKPTVGKNSFSIYNFASFVFLSQFFCIMKAAKKGFAAKAKPSSFIQL